MLMHVTFDSLKTFYNILIQKLKNHRGNWEQNDSTADDYIKNRPFYSEVKYKTLADNLTSEDYYNGNVPKCNFVKGQSYDVILNGVSYKNLVCHDTYGWNVVGGENYPFVLDDNGGDSLYVEYFESEDWTLSIFTEQEVIHQIDKKYVPIPDGLVTEDSLSYVAFSGDYNDLYNQPTVYQDVVRHSSQSLTEDQKAVVRSNIGAGTSDFSGSYADLTDIPSAIQSDWGQSDSTHPSYIIGKTHYEEPVEVEVLNALSNGSPAKGDNATHYWSASKAFDYTLLKEGAVIKFTATIGNTSSEIEDTIFHYTSLPDTGGIKNYYIVGNKSFLNGIETPAITINDGTIFEDTGERYAIVIKIESTLDTYHDIYVLSNQTWNNQRFIASIISSRTIQLDEKYIPDTIARVTDIPESITIDSTLSIEGQSADAKAVGDKFAELVGDTPVADQINNALTQNTQTQPDWNQSNSDAADYIKNRTHYDGEYSETSTGTYSESLSALVCFNQMVGYAESNHMYYYDGTVFSFTVTVDGETYTFDITPDTSTNIAVGTTEAVYTFDNYSVNQNIKRNTRERKAIVNFYITPYNETMTSTCTYSYPVIKQLDEKFIPDTIARTTDVPVPYAHPDTHPASMITGLSDVATSGSYNDLEDKPNIPNTADDFGIYVQAQEPANAVAGDIWIDTANDPSYIVPTIPAITEADNGKILMVVDGKLQLVAVNLSIDADGVVSI